jgi:uncharacterized protein
MSDEPRPPREETRLSPPPSPRRALWEALSVFFLATLVCSILWQLRGAIPFVGKNLHALIAAIFLYVPTFLILRRKEDFIPYGLTTKPVGKGLIYFSIVSLVVFPLFSFGFVAYYRFVCSAAAAGHPVPSQIRGLCRHFIGSVQSLRWRLPKDFAQVALAQLVVVALPEEYFFRGYLQTKLEEVWPSRRRFLGAPVGSSLVSASALFALGHLLVDFNPLRLAVFFPSLVFGWLRQATGSILAGVLFHACSNLISELLHGLFFT